MNTAYRCVSLIFPKLTSSGPDCRSEVRRLPEYMASSIAQTFPSPDGSRYQLRSRACDRPAPAGAALVRLTSN